VLFAPPPSLQQRRVVVVRAAAAVKAVVKEVNTEDVAVGVVVKAGDVAEAVVNFNLTDLVLRTEVSKATARLKAVKGAMVVAFSPVEASKVLEATMLVAVVVLAFVDVAGAAAAVVMASLMAVLRVAKNEALVLARTSARGAPGGSLSAMMALVAGTRV